MRTLTQPELAWELYRARVMVSQRSHHPVGRCRSSLSGLGSTGPRSIAGYPTGSCKERASG